MEGIFHVHSHFSADGVCSLEDLAAFCASRGFCFVVLTEHAECLDEGRMQALVAKCDGMSEKNVLFIPGLEVAFRNKLDLHILCIGVRKIVTSSDPAKTVEETHRQGGLAVVAHPSRNGHRVPEEIIGMIDGIEVWNAAYDSRYLPDPESMELYDRLRARNGTILAFGGLDMHDLGNFREITIRLDDNDPVDAEGLLRKFREGRFVSRGKLMEVASRPHRTAAGRLVLAAGHGLLRAADGVHWSIRRMGRRG